jgi:pantetheine-phosphate adenylyltransferase
MQFSNVYVTHSSGLTVEYAKANQIHCLVRGLRIMSDFEYEQSMDWHNHILAPEIETICLMTRPNLRFVSSRSLKELLRHGQDVQAWLPKPVLEYLKHHPI